MMEDNAVNSGSLEDLLRWIDALPNANEPLQDKAKVFLIVDTEKSHNDEER